MNPQIFPALSESCLLPTWCVYIGMMYMLMLGTQKVCRLSRGWKRGVKKKGEKNEREIMQKRTRQQLGLRRTYIFTLFYGNFILTTYFERTHHIKRIRHLDFTLSSSTVHPQLLKILWKSKSPSSYRRMTTSTNILYINAAPVLILTLQNTSIMYLQYFTTNLCTHVFNKLLNNHIKRSLFTWKFGCKKKTGESGEKRRPGDVTYVNVIAKYLHVILWLWDSGFKMQIIFFVFRSLEKMWQAKAFKS